MQQTTLVMIITLVSFSIAQRTRNDKFRFFQRLPIYSIVNFQNSQCSGDNGFGQGLCLTSAYCTLAGGIPIGRCARNFGVCCMISRTCGGTIDRNNTNFVNPNYPNSFNNNSESCSLTIVKNNPYICQLRLDFLRFRLTPPRDGQCFNDTFTVTCDGSSDMPTLCGNNSGQHAYINFPQNVVSCTLSVVTSGIFERRFDILIQQIPCRSNSLAPTGCLQYHRSIAGTIQSFNTGATPNTGITYPLRLNYGICIRQDFGFCSIQYSVPSDGYFQLDTATESNSNLTCDDSLLIPKATPQVSMETDRYCGTNFPIVTSIAHPIAVYVTSDNQPAGGQGFRLSYLQMPCRQ